MMLLRFIQDQPDNIKLDVLFCSESLNVYTKFDPQAYFYHKTNFCSIENMQIKNKSTSIYHFKNIKTFLLLKPDTWHNFEAWSNKKRDFRLFCSGVYLLDDREEQLEKSTKNFMTFIKFNADVEWLDPW